MEHPSTSGVDHPDSPQQVEPVPDIMFDEGKLYINMETYIIY